MPKRAPFPALAPVDVADLERLDHVVSDFEDLWERHGMLVSPGEAPATRSERVAERFFVNKFHPWTSNSLGVVKMT